ncbi:hypothetical protein [Labrys neptuniae]|uniref:Uncharacterized protein n=1 Tax=Labrys neptuniae TaxID=376174 RepID=A0ABV3PJG9_9HYPH
MPSDDYAPPGCVPLRTKLDELTRLRMNAADISMIEAAKTAVAAFHKAASKGKGMKAYVALNKALAVAEPAHRRAEELTRGVVRRLRDDLVIGTQVALVVCADGKVVMPPKSWWAAADGAKAFETGNHPLGPIVLVDDAVRARAFLDAIDGAHGLAAIDDHRAKTTSPIGASEVSQSTLPHDAAAPHFKRLGEKKGPRGPAPLNLMAEDSLYDYRRAGGKFETQSQAVRWLRKWFSDKNLQLPDSDRTLKRIVRRTDSRLDAT